MKDDVMEYEDNDKNGANEPCFYGLKMQASTSPETDNVVTDNSIT